MKRLLLILSVLLGNVYVGGLKAFADIAGNAPNDTISKAEKDTVIWRNDTEWDLEYEEDAEFLREDADTMSMAAVEEALKDNLTDIVKPKFVPNPIRAMWLGMVFPCGGQIYNRKFWKLPIFYGGYLGCVYAFSWNSQMLRDYSQAYLDIMDDDPNTKSYEKMLPLGYDITGKEDRFKEIFKNKKNYFRKYRDMSVFAFAAVYLLSVIDAYVDAELSTFDISRDLSLHWQPASLNSDTKLQRRLGYRSYGAMFALSF